MTESTKTRRIAVLSSISFGVVLMALAVLLMLAGVLPVPGGGQDAVFRSPVLAVILGLLGLSTLMCMVKRRLAWRTFGFHLTHGSVLVIMVGAALGVVFEEKHTVRLRRDAGPLRELRLADGGMRALDFGLVLKGFRVERYPPTLLVYKSGQRVAEYRVAEGLQFPVGDRALTVTRIVTHSMMAGAPCVVEVAGADKRWLLAETRTQRFDSRYAVMLERAADKYYEADLVISQNDKTTERMLEINKPLTVAGWRIYLQSYDSRARQHITITLRKDPGDSVAVAGMVGLMFGTALIFWGRRRQAS